MFEKSTIYFSENPKCGFDGLSRKVENTGLIPEKL